MIDTSKIAVNIPDGLDKYTIKDQKGNVIVFREPLWLDFDLIENLTKDKDLDNRDKVKEMALRLAISFNNEQGVTLANLMTLDRFGMKEVFDLMLTFQMDTIPTITDRAEELLSKYLPNQ